jgi:hypothetical protein
MRHVLFTLILLAAAGGLAGEAKAQNYPWCAAYGTPGGTNCGFATLQQCMAALGGNGGACEVNTQYTPPAALGRQKSHAPYTG